MFAIGKQYRNASMGCAFLSNDTSFQRSRSIRVDPQAATVDQRPVLTGGDTTSFNTYSSLGWPHAIQNDIGNRQSRETIVLSIRGARLEKRLPIRVFVPKGTGGLAKHSEIDAGQLFTILKSDLGQKVGRMPSEVMAMVDAALKRSLALR